MPNAIVYWLLPEKGAAENLRRTIHELAMRFNAPVFAPHVTICSLPENARPPTEIVSKIRLPTIALEVAEVRQSDQFTKTLFVQFARSLALEELAASICRESGRTERPQVDPHLSLLYHRLPEKARLDLHVELPLPTIHCDGLCAMRCVSPTKTADDVRAWQLIQNSTIRNAG